VPLASACVGARGEPLEHEIDARWTMSYAAGLGDARPAYFDTAARPDVLAHPLFPVCFEWPAFLSTRALPVDAGLTREERLRGVHATHDLVLHRPIRAGIRAITRACVSRVERSRAGARQVVRLDSVDGDGRPLCTTWYGSLFRGVSVDGPDRALDDEPPAPLAPADGAPPRDEVAVTVAAEAAHVYTECARIWNPIHTDAAVARAAGLPSIILHGTATLALGVGAVLDRALGGDPERVGRIAARFAAMVPLPARLSVRIFAADASGAIPFEMADDAGQRVLRNGLVAPRP
jgi:acyl dehydratase